jgi:cyclophilin family peptidyl-prolyl cis-trans isomerase
MFRCLPVIPVLCGIFAVSLTAGCGSNDAKGPPAASINGSARGDGGSQRAPLRDNLHPVIQLRTTAGNIVLQLDAENAPVTVSNFLSYIASGHYDGTLFHDVEEGFIVLGGGYDAQLQEKDANFPIRNEAHNGLKNTRGAIAMARRPDVIDSSTSQFFINLADNTALDHHGETAEAYGYCVFGKVVEGLEIVDKIAKTPTKAVDQFERLPSERIAIESIRRLR